MLDNQPNLEAWMNGGEVQRFHQWPMLHRQQTVAEHTFNMLMISTHLYSPIEGEPEYYGDFCDLQQAILFHDVAEGRRGTSDISAWAKRQIPGLKQTLHIVEAQIALDFGYSAWTQISNENRHRLKMCDKLELMWTVISQLMLGNTVIFDASWPVIMEMMVEMMPDMETNEAQLFTEWRERAKQIRG